MIRYWEPSNSWVSGNNPDEQGMPSTDLSGDTEVCTCVDCFKAALQGLGTNYLAVKTIIMIY